VVPIVAAVMTMEGKVGDSESLEGSPGTFVILRSMAAIQHNIGFIYATFYHSVWVSLQKLP